MDPTVLIDALDDLNSHRTSAALLPRVGTLEKLVAQGCSKPETLREFVRLQDRIDCNIASRLSLHLAYTQDALVAALNSSRGDAPGTETMLVLSVQMLNILQGMALLHSPSKSLLGRPSFLKVLLDMLAICRRPLTSLPAHASPSPSAPPTPSGSHHPIPPASSSRAPLQHANLAIAVLDVLLCLLVDTPVCMRAFEAAQGIEAVVKTLKKAETSRDVRVKCLEFLYFYLLPEDGASLKLQEDETNEPLAPLVREIKAHSNGRATPPARSDPFSTPPSSPRKSVFAQSIDPQAIEPRTPSGGSKSHIASSGDRTPRPSTQQTPSPRKNVKNISISVPSHRLPAPQLTMIDPDMEYFPISPQKVSQVSALGVGRPGQSRRPSPASPAAGSFVGDSSEATTSDGGSSTGAGARPARQGLAKSVLGPTRSMPDDAAIGRKGSFARDRLAVPPKSKSVLMESTTGSPTRKRAAGPRTSGGERDGMPKARTPSSRPSGIFNKSTTASPTPTKATHSLAPSPLITPSPSKSRSKPSSPTKSSSSPSKSQFASSPIKSSGPKSPSKLSSRDNASGTRTTDEKKAMLGVWLGNVDALVQGVQRAGIWGLDAGAGAK